MEIKSESAGVVSCFVLALLLNVRVSLDDLYIEWTDTNRALAYEGQ